MRSLSAALLALFVAVAAPPAAEAAQTRAFVLTSDFQTGRLRAIDLVTRAVTQDVGSVHSDAVVRWYQGLLYVVNRFGGDNIQVIDPAQNYATLRQFSVGNGSNPQDIAFVSPTKAYVSRYGSADLWIVNPSSSSGNPMSTISLLGFADSDGIPEMARMILVDRWLFVACQRLTNFQPINPSVVVVVDTQADTVVDVDPATTGTQAIALAGRNPATTFAFDRANGRLMIGDVGSYGPLDGGIEAIDPVTFQSLGFIATESGLGGDIGVIVWKNGTHSYAIVSDVSSNTALISWNPATGARLATLYSPGGFSLPDAGLNDRGEIYWCNNSPSAPGVVVFSTSTDMKIAGPLSTGLPPVALTFDEATDFVAVPPSPPAFRLSAPLPNPARTAVRFHLELERPERVLVEVLDVAGRRVRRLIDTDQAAGARDLIWDLRSDEGQPLGAGIYFVRARVGSRSFVRRVALIR